MSSSLLDDRLVTVLALNFALVMLLMLGVWLASLPRRDASLVDRFWGVGFALVAVATWSVADGFPPRQLLLLVLPLVWGLRLSLHLTWRNWGTGEDPRYRAMRQRHGERFPWTSLFTVFGLQGILLWVISTPIQVGQVSDVPARWTWLDLAGVALWLVGFLFETVADLQLARFKANPANRGKVLDTGLWRYSRHPNYFGDAVLWWGLFLLAASTPLGPYFAFSPILMTYLLMKISGVPLLERRLVRTRPGYEEYAERTSSFVPWWPEKRS